jgi:hypothetical protein
MLGWKPGPVGWCVPLALTLACSGSRGTQDYSLQVPTRTQVLVGGWISTDQHLADGSWVSRSRAVIWKDGSAVSLVDDPARQSWVAAVTQAGPDQYAVGMDSAYPTGVAVWKNGVETNLTDPSLAANPGALATAIVVSGADVYVGATLTASDGSTTAVYWKNGAMVTLGPGTTEAIAVHGEDLFVAGNSGGTGYWKNGTRYGLGNASGKGKVHGLAVTANGSILVAGEVEENGRSVALLWQDGTPIPLTDDAVSGCAQAVTVSGNDIYVAGWTSPLGGRSHVALWHNGTPTPLPDTEYSSQACAVSVDQGKVYLAGQNDGAAFCWIDGVATALPPANSTTAATSIFVAHL